MRGRNSAKLARSPPSARFQPGREPGLDDPADLLARLGRAHVREITREQRAAPLRSIATSAAAEVNPAATPVSSTTVGRR